MTPQEDPIEKLLRSAALREPSGELDRRVGAAIRRRGRGWVYGVAAAAIVLIVVGVVAVHGKRETKPAPMVISHPSPAAPPQLITATRVLVGVKNDGVIGHVRGGDAVRRVRREVVRQVVSVDPVNGRRIVVIVPHEEVFFVRQRVF